MNSLVLWDIDRTLVTMAGVSQEIYAVAFRNVTGRDLEHAPDLAGRTDYELVATTLALHGIEALPVLFDAFFTALAQGTQERIEDIRLNGRALAGAHAAIEAFAALEGSVQTVATGNVAAVARTKLAVFGLGIHLDLEIGGYGSDCPDRATLIRTARQRAETKHGAGIPDKKVVVVGDTPNDIAGARANGVVAVGVATGRFGLADLRAAGADLVLPSLEEHDPLVELLR